MKPARCSILKIKDRIWLARHEEELLDIIIEEEINCKTDRRQPRTSYIKKKWYMIRTDKLQRLEEASW